MYLPQLRRLGQSQMNLPCLRLSADNPQGGSLYARLEAPLQTSTRACPSLFTAPPPPTDRSAMEVDETFCPTEGAQDKDMQVHKREPTRLVERHSAGSWVCTASLHSQLVLREGHRGGQGCDTGLPRVRIPLAVVDCALEDGSLHKVHIPSAFGQVGGVQFENGRGVWLGRVPAPSGVNAFRHAVCSVRELVVAAGGSSEVSFNEDHGDYLQLGLRGMAETSGVSTHALTKDDIHPACCGGVQILGGWMHANMDLDLDSTGVVFWY
jgi:hypothetical protein